MAVQPKDMSRITESPAELAGPSGKKLKFAPINPVKVCGALGRHVKSQRQDSFMDLAERRNLATDVIAKALAEIEAQPYTMQTMMDEMQTYEGTKFILWQSLLRHQPKMRLDQVESEVVDMVAALNVVLGISGITTAEDEDEENPTESGGQTLQTGVS